MKLKRTTAILSAGLMLAGTTYCIPSASAPASAVTEVRSSGNTAVNAETAPAETTAVSVTTTQLTTTTVTTTTQPAETAPTVIAEGSCGASANWQIDSDGHLLLTGSGDLSDADVNFEKYSDSIRTAELRNSNAEFVFTAVAPYLFKNCQKLTTVKLPDTVRSIGKYAFYACSALAECTLPEGLETIGEHAFRETALTDISIPGCELGEAAFFYCPSLKTVRISEGTAIIPPECFRYCTALTDVTLPDSVTEIQCGYNGGTGAFADCPALTNVSIGKGITAISENAFRTTGNVLTVTFREGVTAVPQTAFRGRTELVGVKLSDSVETIGKYAFAGCSALTDCNFPYALKSIGEQAFRETALTDISLPGCELGEAAFFNCPNLKTARIAEGTAVIPPECFRNCTALTAVRLPDSVKDIQCGYNGGTGAFADCPALQKVSIGTGIETINQNAFRTTGDALTVTFREGASLVPANAFQGRTELVRVILPESMKTIGSYAFAGCWALARCDLPEGLETIGEQAFRETALTGTTIPGCTLGDAAFFNCPSLKTVTFTEGTEIIPPECFRNCTALTDVTLPDSVKDIQCGYNGGTGAFADCPALTNVSIGTDIETINQNAFRTTGDALTVTFREGASLVPAHAFQGRPELVRVILPESMKTIGSYAFAGCTALAGCNLPKGLETIGEQAFRETALTGVTIPGCALGDAAFYNCVSLTFVMFDEGTTVIPNECFRNCTALTSVRLPDSVSEIKCGYNGGTGAFADCPALKTVSVGKDISFIDSRAFRTTGDALTVTFREGVTAIPENAFNNGNVTKIILPETVTEIGAKAVSGCTTLNLIAVASPDCLIADGENTIPGAAVIFAPEASAAQTYAETYSHSFELLNADFRDLNGDGKLTAEDAVLLMMIVNENLPEGTVMPDAEHLAAADCDQDGQLTMTDVRMLLDMA